MMAGVQNGGALNGGSGDPSQGSVVLFASSVDKRTEMSMLMQQVKKQWSDDDHKRCRDLQKYVLDKEDSWVLDRALLKFVGDVLRSISAETKVRIMRVLAVCALKESFVAFLHQDRENRFIMNYVNKFAYLTLEEQKAVSLFICHLFSNPQTQSWALYFSEWTVGDPDDSSSDDSTEDEDTEVQNGHNGTSNGGAEVGQKLPKTVEVDEEAEMTSNARVTAKITRLCLHSLNPTLQSYGGAIAHNLAIRRVRVMHRPLSSEDEVSGESESLSHSHINGSHATLRAHDAVAIELTISIIDLFNRGTFKLTEPVLYQCLTALVSFLPLIKTDLTHYYQKFDEDLKSLEDKKLSNRNQELVKTLMAQI